ncbi:hypothetical protein U9M48_041138 [Paspalum notatum var. saurae]|uniref:Uncharacterized protein n=1 Tax=Paspalum notatum var. saurae TaxID=547442 RepID=A0AAQ3XEH9_PASNO
MVSSVASSQAPRASKSCVDLMASSDCDYYLAWRAALWSGSGPARRAWWWGRDTVVPQAGTRRRWPRSDACAIGSHLGFTLMKVGSPNHSRCLH